MQQTKEMKPKKFTHASRDGKVIFVDIEECNPDEVIFIPVSPESKYHENGHFEAFLQYAYERKLNICVINTGYLKRFTRQLLEGAEEVNESVKDSARRITDRWNTRNLVKSGKASIVEDMKRNFAENKEGAKLQYSTWEDWTIGKHEERFKHFLLEIEKAYGDREEHNFHLLMDGAVDDFFTNFHKSNENKDDYPEIFASRGEEGVKAIIRQYIFEEAAVNLLWVELGIKQEAYPFSQNTTCHKTVQALKIIIEKLFPDRSEETMMKFLNLVVKEDSPRGLKPEGQQQQVMKNIAINDRKLEAARLAKQKAEERARQLEEEKKAAEKEKKAAEEEKKKLEAIAQQLEERARQLEEKNKAAEETRQRLEDMARKQRQRTLLSTKILRAVDEEQRGQKLDPDVADEFRTSAIAQIERAAEEMDPSYRKAPLNGTNAHNAAIFGMHSSATSTQPKGLGEGIDDPTFTDTESPKNSQTATPAESPEDKSPNLIKNRPEQKRPPVLVVGGPGIN